MSVFQKGKRKRRRVGVPPAFQLACGPSAQLCDFPVEGGSQDHWLSQALFHDVLREVSVATEGASRI